MYQRNCFAALLAATLICSPAAAGLFDHLPETAGQPRTTLVDWRAGGGEVVYGDTFDHPAYAGQGYKVGHGYPFVSGCCRQKRSCCEQLWQGFCQQQRCGCQGLARPHRGGKGAAGCAHGCGSIQKGGSFQKGGGFQKGGSLQKGGKTHLQHGLPRVHHGQYQQKIPRGLRHHVQGGCGAPKCGAAKFAPAGPAVGKGKARGGCGHGGRLGLFDWHFGKGCGCDAAAHGQQPWGVDKWQGGEVWSESDQGDVLHAPPAPVEIAPPAIVPVPESGPAAQLRRLPATRRAGFSI